VKKYLITGLLIWIPLVITIWVLKLVVDTLDQSLLLLPEQWRTESFLGVHIPGLGVILTLVIVLVTGVFATNFFGAQLVHVWHEILHRIPVVNSIYSSVKQISDTLFSSSGQAFRKALLVQWPQEGMWTIAFLTGTPGGGAPSRSLSRRIRSARARRCGRLPGDRDRTPPAPAPRGRASR